jgi:hypothetical protein
MMVLLHDAIAEIAMASVLYSDIGHFYAKTVRRHEDSSKAMGWTVMSPLQVTWKVEELEDFAKPRLPSRSITEQDLPDICLEDAELMEMEIKSYRVSVFALLPTFDQMAWALERSKKMTTLLAPQLELHSWGARIGGENGTKEDWAFVIWAYNFAEKSLIIGRLRCDTTDQLRVLLSAAKRAAEEYKLQKIEAWNVPEYLLKGTGWENKERPDHLPALAWYGHGQLPSMWLAEAWAWC